MELAVDEQQGKAPERALLAPLALEPLQLFNSSTLQLFTRDKAPARVRLVPLAPENPQHVARVRELLLIALPHSPREQAQGVVQEQVPLHTRPPRLGIELLLQHA